MCDEVEQDAAADDDDDDGWTAVEADGDQVEEPVAVSIVSASYTDTRSGATVATSVQLLGEAALLAPASAQRELSRQQQSVRKAVFLARLGALLG